MWSSYQQEESVYNLIPRPAEQIVKPPMYRSKHKANVPPSCSTLGLKGTTKLTANDSGMEDLASAAPIKPAATFGREVIANIDPGMYLKKGAKTRQAAPAEVKTFQRPILQPNRPHVPKKTEKPVMGLTTEKNFVVANAVENILAVPKRPAKEPAAFTQGRSFGKVPKYLSKIKRDIELEHQYIDQMNQQQNPGDDRMRQMTESEKNEIISGLKAKWDEIHKQYQSLTFSVDSISKVNRKEGLEMQMEQLEKAIQKLSKKNIHIYDDSDMW